MAWPPTIEDLKVELKRESEPDDPRMQSCLDAAVVVVQRLREGDLNFGLGEDGEDDLPDPGADVHLGTLRLAWRWYTRRRSPDALVQMAELGNGRVPMFDNDIEMLLQIGRHHGPVIAG